MSKTLILIDAGFLSKLSKHFGGGYYLKYDIIKLSENLARKENLECSVIYYYTSPPFQSEFSSKEEMERKEKYDKFIKKLSFNKKIAVREGRCQRLKIDGKFIYKQKAVDTLMIMDLMRIPLEHKEIKKIILIASDSDFVPIVEYLQKIGLEIILYTHYTKKRSTNFSRSNALLQTVTRYSELSKQDFLNSLLNEENKK